MEFQKTSTEINEIAKALCQFQKDCPPLELDREVTVKTKTGGEYKFKYSTMTNIVETAKPILAANGLSFTQLIEEDGTVITMLLHSSGQYLSSSLHIKGEATPQGIGSAITYAKRYSLASILGIVSDDDDDANIASGNTFNTADKNKKIENNLPWLNKGTKEFAGAVEKLRSGQTTIAKIKTVMKISKEVEGLLNEALQPAVSN